VAEGPEAQAEDEERDTAADGVEQPDQHVQRGVLPVDGPARHAGVDQDGGGDDQQRHGQAHQGDARGAEPPIHREQYSGRRARRRRAMSPRLRALVVAAGLAAIAGMVLVTGIETLLSPLQALSWWLAVVVLLPYALVMLIHTLAWQALFAAARAPLGRLLAIRLAGEALNEAAASVGGEPLKAYLLQPAVPPVEASAAVVVDKTAITLSQVLFLALGLALAPTLGVSSGFLGSMAALLAVQVVAVTAFVLTQSTGLLGAAVRRLQRLGLGSARWRPDLLLAFDRSVAVAYRQRRGRLLACVLVHLLGWVAGSLEVYLALRWMGVDVSFARALAIDACGTGIKFLAFAVPGALGVLEGGFMLVFGALGLGSGLGLTFTVVRRVRMVVWALLGLVTLAFLRAPAADLATPPGSPRAASRP
jgi:uncharacterized protein (TIRG00374 family)